MWVDLLVDLIQLGAQADLSHFWAAASSFNNFFIDDDGKKEVSAQRLWSGGTHQRLSLVPSWIEPLLAG